MDFLSLFSTDRNRTDGGVLVSVNEDFPSKILKIHKIPNDIQNIFVEINLLKTIWLFCGCSHPPSHTINTFLNKSDMR